MFEDLDFFDYPLTPAPGRPATRPAVPQGERPGLAQLLLETQPAALFLLDGAGLILEVGGAWEAVTGIPPAEASGQPLHRWLRYDRARHPGVLRGAGGVLEEVTLTTRQGSQVARVAWASRGGYIAGSLEPLAPAAQHAFRTAERLQDTERALDEVVRLLGVSQDAWQADHVRRIVDLAERLAAAAGLSPAEVRAVRWGAALHDVGKARVPQAILQKPGPLDPLEHAVIRQHPAWGVQLLADLLFLPLQTLDAVRHHHERWDGRGYPIGLSGHHIPLGARIVSIADVFDALLSTRPYKRAWSYQEAVDYLITEAGRQFDPHLTRIFVCQVLGFTHLEDRFGCGDTGPEESEE
ncbi:HD-GYP domain-containing protein [Deinococcus apachensis]|uniref:HD-GYP domain-containing protein n=1 Tax=Deinococcus apachensis TaxID=309886 RepID=UPI00036BE571|nr:HD domain-containing phosphohydrolase [Deinococcus apachensis]